MVSKIVNLTVTFLLLSFLSTAQIYLGGHLGLNAGYNNSKSFNTFRDAYNLSNETYINKKMSKPILAYGFGGQFDCYVGHLFSAVGFTRTSASARATFPNKAERHMTMNQLSINALIGYASNGDMNEFSIYSGFTGSFSSIIGYVKYPTKDRDYTYGTISGIFTSPGFRVPLCFQFSRKIEETNFWFYSRLTAVVLSATKLTYFNTINSAGFGSSALVYGDVEIIDDTKQVLLEIGIKYKIDTKW